MKSSQDKKKKAFCVPFQYTYDTLFRACLWNWPIASPGEAILVGSFCKLEICNLWLTIVIGTWLGRRTELSHSVRKFWNPNEWLILGLVTGYPGLKMNVKILLKVSIKT